MGTVSSCCGGAEKESQVEFTQPPGEGENTLQDSDDFAVKKEECLKKLRNDGMEVCLILQDKTRLACRVLLSPDSEFILLSCDKKVRAIAFHDIKAILHTREKLRRVETSAGITDPAICAAIHLATSGNCIPLFFNTPDDKKCFAAIMEELRSSVASKAGVSGTKPSAG